MLQPTQFTPQPHFAGQKKKTSSQSILKTGFIGLLLGTAGSAAAFSNPRQNVLDNMTGTPTADALELSHHHRQLLASSPTPPASRPAPRQLIRRPSRVKPTPPPPHSQAILDQRLWNASSLTPKNYELFSKVTFPNTSPMTPAPLKPYTEAEIKAQLVPFLNKITGGNRTKNTQALAVFNDPILKQKTNNDPKIRAMLASLQALGFDSVINTYKSNRFSTLKFNPVPFQDATGYSVRFNNETQQQVWLNPRYQGEDWKQLIDTVLHEALHDDTTVGNAEELINTAMDSLVGTKVRLLDPTIVTQNTELSRRLNTASLYRMLSRGPNGELRMNSTKPNVLPLRNFGARYGISKPEDVQPSPGNPLLASLLRTFTGKTVSKPNFDWNTIQLLDQNQKYLSYSELLQAAKLLQLNVATPKSPAPRQLITFEELDSEAPAPAPTLAEADQDLAPETAPASAPAPEANDRKRSRRLLA